MTARAGQAEAESASPRDTRKNLKAQEVKDPRAALVGMGKKSGQAFTDERDTTPARATPLPESTKPPQSHTMAAEDLWLGLSVFAPEQAVFDHFGAVSPSPCLSVSLSLVFQSPSLRHPNVAVSLTRPYCLTATLCVSISLSLCFSVCLTEKHYYYTRPRIQTYFAAPSCLPSQETCRNLKTR